MRNPVVKRVLAVCSVLVAAGAILSIASPANASTTRAVVPTLTGYGYDNTDPISTGCSADATTMRSATIKDKWGSVVGKIELRYSVNCHTAWARITNYYTVVPFDSHSGTADLFRSDGASVAVCYTPAGTNTSCYTKQLYDKDPLTARAYGEIDNYPAYYGTSSSYTTWY